MLVQFFSNKDHHFACSKYGQDWAGPDGDRLTLALSLMKQLPADNIQLGRFSENLEFVSSVDVQEILEASTDWVVNDEASYYLHSHSEKFLVAITTSLNEPTWPEFDGIEFSPDLKNELQAQWATEVVGVSQGAYVSQAQHLIASPARLGLLAQDDNGRMVWPPRQLNSRGDRITSTTKQLSETATILSWTRLSAAGAPSEFSGRAPVLDGISTVLVQFDEGPRGVFMLADDEERTPEIDGTVRFDVRRLYGQDGMIHYGLKAVLVNS